MASQKGMWGSTFGCRSWLSSNLWSPLRHDPERNGSTARQAAEVTSELEGEQLRLVTSAP